MIFDLFDIDTIKLAARLHKYGYDIDSDMLSLIIDIIISIIILIFICKVIHKYTILPYKTNREWRKAYIDKELGHNYSEYLTPKAQKLFIDTKFQSKAPSDYTDPMESLYIDPTDNLLTFYLNKVLVLQNTNNALYCVLAGSGMGKTTFSVNLLIRYIRKYSETSLPFPIHLLSLSNERIIEQIESIEEKNRKVLILDALDENTNATENFDLFIQELESCIEKFKIVILTCRTQFFPDEEKELRHSRLRNYGKNKGFKVYNKHYIAPFSSDDINLYLSKMYSWKRKKKKKAKRIVEKCNSLMIRPLLLSYIDLLVDYQTDYNHITDIYEVLIKKWIDREAALLSVDKQEEMKAILFKFSQQIAIDIYLNKTERGGFFIKKEELTIFLNEYSFDAIPYSFSGRSLLNRDALGYIKFSHKSFLEFFIALEMFYNNNFSISFDGIDMAKLFFVELCHKELDVHIKNGNLIIESFESKIRVENIQNKKMTLVLKKKIDYDFTHLQQLYQITDVKSEWSFLDKNFLLWLETTFITSITITNYDEGNLRPLLKIPKLKYLVINGSPLSKTFIKEANKKGIIISWNNNVLDINIGNLIDAPLTIQLNLLKNKQTQRLEQITSFLFEDNDK